MTVRQLLTFATALLALAACAEPKTSPPQVSQLQETAEQLQQGQRSLDRLIAGYRRLAEVGEPLMLAGADFCGSKTIPAIGASAWNPDYVPSTLRTEIGDKYGMRGNPTLWTVVPNGPADRAGLKPGDKIIDFGGIALDRRERQRPGILGALAKVARVGQPLPVSVERQGVVLDLEVTPTARCDLHLVLNPSDGVVAYGDARHLIFTQGMLDLASSDPQLAVLIGHEIAHNAMGHGRPATKDLPTGLFAGTIYDVSNALFRIDSLAALRRARKATATTFYNRLLEREADYVGLYIAAIAGFPVDGAGEVWREIATRAPGSIAHTRLHPAEEERFVGLDLTSDEIDGKLAREEALVPTGLQVADASRLIGSKNYAEQEARRPPDVPDSWGGHGAADACGEPWRLEFSVTSGEAVGRMVRGNLIYDFRGSVSNDGRSVQGRAVKDKEYEHFPGARFLSVTLDLEQTAARGEFSIETINTTKCRTPVTLRRLT